MWRNLLLVRSTERAREFALQTASSEHRRAGSGILDGLGSIDKRALQPGISIIVAGACGVMAMTRSVAASVDPMQALRSE